MERRFIVPKLTKDNAEKWFDAERIAWITDFDCIIKTL